MRVKNMQKFKLHFAPSNKKILCEQLAYLKLSLPHLATVLIGRVYNEKR